MEKLEKLVNRYFLIIIFILSVPVVWALFVPGFYGASDDIHIAWLHQMDRVIGMGQIPPRFVPDLSFGFGYPLFNFVFPLPFYLAEIFHLLSFSLVDSIKAVFILSMPLSGIFMYLLLRYFTSSSLALTGATLYMFTPYRAVDLYIRGAIGEIVSFVFLPLIILSVLNLTQAKNWRWVGIGAIALASLVLSHNITAYMFTPFLILLLIMLFFSVKQKRVFLLKSILMIFLSLVASIYFWLPAIMESRLFKHDTVFNFADHFPTLKQLFTPYWGYGASVPGPHDGMSFFLGFINIVVLFSGILFLFLKRSKMAKLDRVVGYWIIISLALVFFFLNHRSAGLWSNIPLLPFFQFPWRFLAMTTFLIPLILITFKYVNFKKIVWPASLFFIILTSWQFFRPEHFLGRTDDYFLNRYIPIPTASDEYKQLGEEYLRLPKATQRRPDSNFPILTTLNNPMIDTVKINDLHYIFNIYAKSETTINFNKYYFPGWQAKLNDQQIELEAGSPFGQITASVPAGKSKLEIYFGESLYKRFLNFASLVAFLVLLMLLAI